MNFFAKALLFLVNPFAIGVFDDGAIQNPPKTQIIYIRHGEVPGNNQSPTAYIYTGSGTDDSLTENGGSQALRCAERIAQMQKDGLIGKVSAIYSSHLKRAIETAMPIANALQLDLERRENLKEIDWGCADGKLVAEINAVWDPLEIQVIEKYPDQKKRWDHLPVFDGAETYNALLNRTLKELNEIANEHLKETILIVGHGRVLKTLIANDLGTEENLPYPPNCGMVEFSYSPQEGVRFVGIL